MLYKGFLKDLIVILIIVIIALSISRNIAIFKISGNSMNPTYKDGDIALILKSKEVKLDEVSIVNSPEEWELGDKKLIKRVIAKEGDILEVNGDSLIRNEIVIDDISDRNCFKNGVIKIEEGEAFIMGDNHSSSTDSLDKFCKNHVDFKIKEKDIIFSGKNLFIINRN